MISKDLARKFIEQVTQYTDFNVNIMNADGTIIASRDPGRVGQFHEVAVVTNFGAMSPDRGYKTQTMNTLVMGIAAIVEIALLSLVLH